MAGQKTQTYVCSANSHSQDNQIDQSSIYIYTYKHKYKYNIQYI